ncbi:MAG: hypothetical protein EPN79_11860 [Burkholderiaceae bacterium]|nr:MAG: hypothetical protein EPN79_11860 [Burkholderiaceae bacterium]TBR76649.1 MAG: hypothetical protein EPN64_05205 [Burkholderiaceae bacterium]
MNGVIDLLDCSQEPSDEQLEELMGSVAAEANAKASVSDAALMRGLRAQAAELIEERLGCHGRFRDAPAFA